MLAGGRQAGIHDARDADEHHVLLGVDLHTEGKSQGFRIVGIAEPHVLRCLPAHYNCLCIKPRTPGLLASMRSRKRAAQQWRRLERIDRVELCPRAALQKAFLCLIAAKQHTKHRVAH